MITPSTHPPRERNQIPTYPDFRIVLECKTKEAISNYLLNPICIDLNENLGRDVFSGSSKRYIIAPIVDPELQFSESYKVKLISIDTNTVKYLTIDDFLATKHRITFLGPLSQITAENPPKRTYEEIYNQAMASITKEECEC